MQQQKQNPTQSLDKARPILKNLIETTKKTYYDSVNGQNTFGIEELGNYIVASLQDYVTMWRTTGRQLSEVGLQNVPMSFEYREK